MRSSDSEGYDESDEEVLYSLQNEPKDSTESLFFLVTRGVRAW